MNKIKLLYDVVQTMRAKETVKGNVNVEVQKDGENVLALKKDFEKDMVSEMVKVSITSEMNHEGKQVKHESTTEFHSGRCCRPSHHEIFSHIHAHHQGHGCLKEKLTKLAFALSILNSMEVENSDDKTVISLDLQDVQEEIKALSREKRETRFQANRHGSGFFSFEQLHIGRN